MGAPQISSLHTILGPPDHFLRLLYGAPQIGFFSYNMGAPLRSVSLFTLCPPPPPIRSVSLHAIRGPPQILVFSQSIWGAPSDQFLRLLYGAPQVSFFAYYMVSPQISFCAYFLGAALRSIFFSYHMGPPQISFFAYYMGGPSDQFLHLLYRGPLRSVSSLVI